MFIRMHEKLIAWQESYKLCLWIYALTKKLPSDERFSLINQMRRSSYSAPTNIAEGNAKASKKDRSRFFEIGLASLEELHCQCRLSKDLGYITAEEFLDAHDKISRVSYLLHKLIDAQK